MLPFSHIRRGKLLLWVTVCLNMQENVMGVIKAIYFDIYHICVGILYKVFVSVLKKENW